MVIELIKDFTFPISCTKEEYEKYIREMLRNYSIYGEDKILKNKTKEEIKKLDIKFCYDIWA